MKSRPGSAKACLVFALAFALLPTACRNKTPPTSLRLVTYNIHHGEGNDGSIDLPRLAHVTQSLHPDLVALQEVDIKTARTGQVDQAAELARLTGMHYVFGKAIDFDGGQYGNVVLSRYP